MIAPFIFVFGVEVRWPLTYRQCINDMKTERDFFPAVLDSSSAGRAPQNTYAPAPRDISRLKCCEIDDPGLFLPPAIGYRIEARSLCSI